MRPEGYGSLIALRYRNFARLAIAEDLRRAIRVAVAEAERLAAACGRAT